MKHTFIKIAAAAAILLAAVSCSKKEEYKPQEEGSQVFFSNELPSSYNLRDYETNQFTIDINRQDASQDVTVSLQLTGADSIFTISPEVKFAAGKTVEQVTVIWDTTKVKDGIDYALCIKIKNDTTVYGSSKYEFTAGIPGKWTEWGKGHIYEDCWNEDYDATLYYQETEYANIWYCMIKDAWWELDESEKPVKVVGNYYFYWDTEKDSLYIPSQHIGLYTPDGDEIWVSTAAEFYNLYYSWGVVIPSQEYFDWALKWNAKNGFNNGYYDKNGGFYLGDWMYFVNGEAPTGRGYQWGGNQDYFIAEGFERTTNFNDAKHYGSSLPLFTGTDTSYFFSQDGGKTPYVVDWTFLRYSEPKDSMQGTTTYYLGEFFTDSNCLAFTAPVPDSLVNGSPITDVENEQFTGRYSFGEQIWVSVKGGTVIVPTSNEETFPTFQITLKVYTKDAAGAKSHDMGTVTETFVADGILKDNYTIDDIEGADFNDYLGEWTFYSTDTYYGKEYYYETSIIYGGTDDSGNQIALITNFSGYEYSYDTLKAVYDSTYGVLSIESQRFSHTNDDGDSVDVYLFDPAYPTQVTNQGRLLGGMCEDGALAFVNTSLTYNFCGLAYVNTDRQLEAEVYYAYGFKASSFASSQPAKAKRKEYVTLPSESISVVGSGSRMTMVSGKTSSRTFTLTPVEKSSRNSLKTLSPAVSFCK